MMVALMRIRLGLTRHLLRYRFLTGKTFICASFKPKYTFTNILHFRINMFNKLSEYYFLKEFNHSFYNCTAKDSQY